MHRKNEPDHRQQIEKSRHEQERRIEQEASREGFAIGRARGYRVRTNTNKS